MSKDFRCRTCKHLATVGFDRDGKAVIGYECDAQNIDLDNPDSHFCADHTDRETVKRIREAV